MSKDKNEQLVMVPLSHLKSNLTPRQWYAGMALQGLLAQEPCIPSDEVQGGKDKTVADGYVREAYLLADKMIKAGGDE